VISNKFIHFLILNQVTKKIKKEKFMIVKAVSSKNNIFVINCLFLQNNAN
tara:strand:- start:1317 stop:1466 length:150 start_codon:yes stop_codon:yes gene_type:complete